MSLSPKALASEAWKRSEISTSTCTRTDRPCLNCPSQARLQHLHLIPSSLLFHTYTFNNIKTSPLFSSASHQMESPSRAASRRNSISSTDSASSSSAQALPRFTDLTPARPPTTVPGEEAYVEVSGAKNGGVRLKVDAGTGCGGITWASGEVSWGV